MQNALSTAMEMHRSGQLEQAVRLYQAVLSREPENAEALHLLGVAHHQQGDNAQAIELIGRAVALRPNAPAFHANLAEAYRARGQFERAAGCCRTALLLSPNYAEAHCNLGAALQGMQRHEESAAHFRRALAVRPDFSVAHNNLAIALRELGQRDEAFEHFSRAVELEPAFAMARSNLGQMLLDRGGAEEALAHCREAVRLQPDVAALQHNLANVLRNTDKYVEARAAYLEALRLDPDLAVSQAHLGLVLQREGKHGDALPWLKRAVELEPANADFWTSLAELFGDMEDFAEVIPCWERVLALDPQRVQAHLGMGWALQEQGRLEDAARYYCSAAQLQPDSGMAQLNIGGLYEELGQLSAAEETFRKALALQPRFALPHARLATLLRGKMPAADVVALEERLADETLGNGPRARLLFALAHVLDAQSDYARAAECLRQANALMMEVTRERREYSSLEHQQFVDRLLSVFDRGHFNRWHGAGNDSRRPVFVFGLPRSGTTLVEQVLASHPSVHGAGELRLVRKLFEAMPALLARTDWPIDCVPHLQPATIQSLADRHLERLRAIDDRAERIIDKMPDNYMYVGFLATLFPQAVFIHCRRDLRDVAVSCWMTDFRSVLWANDPQYIVDRFSQYRRLMDHWHDTLATTVHHIDYEETVADLESVAKRLVSACGLPWDPACLDYHKLARPVRTASLTQVRQPVYKKSVARWKNYERELGDLFARLPIES
ncbi:MAG TPA: tetratricopeptide repeat protein [Pirellulales bacterium]|jgi:tetratricopeptide (TPR) repeat protein